MTRQDVESTAADEPTTMDIGLATNKATRWYWTGTALLTIVVLWLLIGSDLAAYLTSPRPSIQIDDVNYRPKASQWHEALEDALNAHTEASVDVITMLEGDLSHQVSELFTIPRENVAKAADWFYSPEGVLYRTAATFGADVAGKLLERMFPEDIWSERQAELVASVTNKAIQHGSSVSAQVRDTFHSGLAPSRDDHVADSDKLVLTLEFQHSDFIDLLVNDPIVKQHATSFAMGGTASVTASRAAEIALRRKATTVTGGKLATYCAAAGPMGWLCAAGVFSLFFVGSEAIAIVVDEARNRDEFELALHAEIDRVEESFHEGMHEAFVGGLSAQLKSQRSSIESQVRPIDLILRQRSGLRQ